MIGTLLTVYGVSASALGGYNISRFLATRAIKLRRARKAARSTQAKLDKAVEYGAGVYERFKTGDLDPAVIHKIVEQVKAGMAYTPPAAPTQ